MRFVEFAKVVFADIKVGQAILRSGWVGMLAASTPFILPAFLPAAEPSDQLVKAMSYAPRQPDVNYERVPENQLGECAIEKVTRDDGTGFWITGPAGQPLRWFADTDDNNKLDRWSYYNAGVEVYREIDRDGNQKADEYRWLSTEGMRWGKDSDEDGDIDGWDMISAEEVTAEVVSAAASRDGGRFSRLLISDAEITGLGLGAEKQALLKQRVADAKQQFVDWSAGQNVITPRSRWTNFGADKPGVVPAGTDGSQRDIIVYENVVALLEDAGTAKQLLVGTIIQVGPTWRLVDLPKAVTEGAVVSGSGIFLPAAFSPRGAANTGEASGGISQAMERLVIELQEVDDKLVAGGGNTAVLQAKRADVLEKLVSAATTPEDRGTWIRQFADTVSAAAQAGEYPDGVARLRDFTAKMGSVSPTTDEIAYVVYRTLEADYREKMMVAKDDEFEDLQKGYLKNLEAFVAKFPDSNDSADALIQIGLSAEFSGETAIAKQSYQKASSSFGDTLSGRKATGALARLELVGSRFGLKGRTLDNREFSSASYLGGPVIYHCWASWCGACKAEMQVLKQLQAKYAKAGLKIVGINFDSSQNDLQDRTTFLKANNFPWLQLAEEGGLDGELAVRYGILTLPMNVIVDETGQVVKTGVHSTEMDRVLEEMTK